MVKYFRWALAWTLYGLGDLASKIMELVPDSDGESKFVEGWYAFWYPVYNNLMGWSCDIQGLSDFGPWEHVKDE